MRKLSKTLLSLLLIAAMLASFVVLPAAAEEPAAEQPTEAVQAAETQATESSFMKIFHLDCGRKYFTKDWILALINEISAAGYTHLQLAVGNDGMRFLLDDMSLTVGDKTYSSEDVTAAIHAGNVAYDNRQSYTPEKDELTQSEMDAIISYAVSKGITVIPLINNPGHMDAILSAATSLTGTTCSYNGSVTTINLENEDAVAFTKAFLTKYVEYFAAKGCTHFGIGADEYANDVYTSGSMGFGQLVNDGKYGKFIAYVNSVAGIVKSSNMKPIAFNDGFYFSGNTNSGTFDTDIVVSYWSSGWTGYTSERPAALANRGHKLINTNGSYYYVLGKNDAFTPGESTTHDPSLYTAVDFDKTVFEGKNVTYSDPIGATFCVWCDYPGAETEQEIAKNIRLVLRAMAQRMDGKDVLVDENELVSGGFKADGTINADVDFAVDEETGIKVSAPGVKAVDVTAKTDNLPEVTGAAEVLAWEVTPRDADGNAYTGKGTVTLRIPEAWTGAKVYGAVVNEDGSVSEGTNLTLDEKNHTITFTVPHFSTILAVKEYAAQTISLTVGQEDTVFIKGDKDLSNDITKNADFGEYAELVSAVYGSKTETTIGVSGKATSLKDNDTIVLTDGKGNYAKLNSETSNLDPTTNENEATVWTVEKNGSSSYYLKTDGSYLIPSNNGSTYSISSQKSPWRWSSANGFYYRYYYYGYTYYYLGYSNGTWAMSTSNSGKGLAYVYGEKDTTVNGTTLTFKGLKAGTTYVTVDNIQYKVVVSAEDLKNVTPLTIEYWITNMRPTGSDSKTELTIAATDAGVATEKGIEISARTPATATTGKRTLEYWQSKILDVELKNSSTSGTELQTKKNGDDETLNGAEFTKVRYWDGKWQVFTNTWVDVDRTQVTFTYTGDNSTTIRYSGDKNQLVAYYMEVVSIKNDNGESELHVNAADWGTKGDGTGSWGYKPEDDRCSVSIQLVYEDGSFNPSDTTAAKLKSKTILYGYWPGGRGLGTMVFTGQQGYEIYKVTAETGTMDSETGSGYTVTVTSFTWDKNEETVWEGDQTKSVSIGNPTRKPSYEAPYDNLAWNTGAYNKNNAILIRVYVKAEIKEDSLKVHYVNLKNNSEFYTYAINVAAGETFDSRLAMDLSKETYLVYNTVNNTNGAVQTVNGNLRTLAEVGANYRSGSFELTKVELLNGDKDVWLYYNFKNEYVFVVDFGVPVHITAENIEAGSGWKTASVDNKALKYGTATIDVGEGLTYTATKPMRGVETLTVTLGFNEKDENGNDSGLTYLIYLVPATTVYYEPNVATYTGVWSKTASVTGYQQTQPARKAGYNNFGYDDFYKTTQSTVKATTEIGASAQLTFKGTGMELYLRTQNANETSNPETEANNATDHSYMLVQVYAGDKVDTANLKRMSFVDVNNLFVQSKTGYGYNTPCWTVDGMDYGTYTVVVRYVKGTTYGLAIDGFRVTNTLNPSDATTQNFYAAVGEDNMQTSEIRNMVLAQVSAQIPSMADDWYVVGDKVIDAVFDETDGTRINGAVIIEKDETTGASTVEVNKNLVNIGPKNEIYLQPNQAVVMSFTEKFGSVQVGMRSLTGDTVTYKINGTQDTMTSTVDMYNKVNLAEGKLVIQNVSGGILALTKLKVTGTATTTNDVSVETTPEAIRYAMALMRGIDVPQFTDVAEDAWYHDYVYDLVYRGVVNGMTATTYEPEGKLTRAQFVKLLACSLADAETLKTYEGKHPFKDSEGHWAEAYIAWAKDKGIVEGVSATEFDPEAPITREQMATIFGRYALKQGIELPKSENAAGSFPDADKISEYAREFVELMRIAGILNGYEDGTFRPQGNATRAEAAKLFSLFLSITDKLAK